MEQSLSASQPELMAQTSAKCGTVNHILDVKDISVNGIFITTTDIGQTRSFHVDQEVDMDIYATDELNNIDVDGRIISIQKSGGEYGLGIQFEDITEEKRAQLAELVQTAFRLYGRPPMLPSQLVN